MTADVLRADAVASGADDAADMTLDDVDALIDDADTVIDCAGTTIDVFSEGTKSLTFGLKLLLTLIEPDWHGSNSAEVFLL